MDIGNPAEGFQFHWQGKTCHGEKHGDAIQWDDGDVWTRADKVLQPASMDVNVTDHCRLTEDVSFSPGAEVASACPQGWAGDDVVSIMHHQW